MKVFALTPLIVLAMLQSTERVVIMPRDASPETKASLAGTVISEATGEPIVGATVTMSRQFATIIEKLAEDGNSAGHRSSSNRSRRPILISSNRGGFLQRDRSIEGLCECRIRHHAQ